MKAKHKTIETFHREEIARQADKKAVRINDRTIILVAANIPDDEARQNFLLKQDENMRKHDKWMKNRKNVNRNTYFTLRPSDLQEDRL